MLNVANAECHDAECRGALYPTQNFHLCKNGLIATETRLLISSHDVLLHQKTFYSAGPDITDEGSLKCDHVPFGGIEEIKMQIIKFSALHRQDIPS